jgi:hypothetical protein
MNFLTDEPDIILESGFVKKILFNKWGSTRAEVELDSGEVVVRDFTNEDQIVPLFEGVRVTVEIPV